MYREVNVQANLLEREYCDEEVVKELSNARATIQCLEFELTKTCTQRDKLEEMLHEATEDAQYLQEELSRIVANLCHMATTSKKLSASSSRPMPCAISSKRKRTISPSTSNPNLYEVSYSERPKIQADTGIWLAEDEKSQLIVSPPRQYRKRTRGDEDYKRSDNM
ncbi:hypothetical protein BDY19DRAFT_906535 [Irpex rosettiformis]|uniref:Uncharacterized protein n=1 Tax=Irpex rosettiformis TaxID=378272 RepID=A0ACB8U2H0_9APHY|nr:hypothetical protein BDY19DRAFT_906535 [Irpex rosettiformis]